MTVDHQQRADLRRRRAARIAETLARVRVLDPGTAAAPAHLAAIKTEMIKLAGCGLFDLADFPPTADGGDVTYLLHHDPDGRFGLYLMCGRHCAPVPPHDHKTWAVIAGIRGVETNTLYRREGGLDGDEETVSPRAEIAVTPGRGIALGPCDVHTIRFDGGAQVTATLHLYGRALDRITERVKFTAGGVLDGTYRTRAEDCVLAPQI